MRLDDQSRELTVMLRGHHGRAILLASVAAILVHGSPAHAQSAAQIEAIQSQIRALNQQMGRIRRDMAAKDAALRAAQEDAAHARATAEQTQTAVANLPRPAGFKPGNGSPSQTDLSLGLGPAHPEYPSPKTDWTSLNINGTSASSQNAGNTGALGTFHIGGVTIQLGGFVAMESLFRSRNETTSIGSNWNAIPFPQSQQNHEGEFRMTAQQSRFSMLMHGDIDPNQHVEGYVELDLQGAAGTANSNESNSYNPRLRQAYVSYDNDALDLHALGGQSWSLATMFKQGVTPHQEDVPLTIDAQYVPGFTWTRQPQLRVAKGFDAGKFWLAASLEAPQTTYSVGSNGTGVNLGTVNYNNTGISGLDPTASYSTDIAPDVIVKAAADPGYGHYELYGLARFMQDRVAVVGNGHSNTRLAGGVGGGFILPILGSALSVEGRALAGYGIGRYGSGQLPDAPIGRDGAPVPLPEVQALVGLVAHPQPDIDLYSYVGTEQIHRKYFTSNGTAYGYGNPLYSNAGCDIELSTASCTANTSGLTQGTIGAWWRFLHGNYGTIETGAQYSYTRRTIFAGATGAGGTGNAATDDNIVMFSLRYLPFQ
jgi:outer membrane murein-binding lipoprotein Lpp